MNNKPLKFSPDVHAILRGQISHAAAQAGFDSAREACRVAFQVSDSHCDEFPLSPAAAYRLLGFCAGVLWANANR